MESRLTPREREIVDRLGDWQSVKTISRELQINQKTVYCHIANVAELLPDRGPPLRKVQRWAVTRNHARAPR